MNLPGINNAHPDHIGQYQLISVLGRGGMGIVYLARDTRLDRQVAIKCLRTELFESHYIERFKREALLLAKLNHPNIVQIYDFIESPEQLALVMEYVDGDNLHKRLREQLVPMQQRLRWLTQITQGLAVAHDAGIIHRDLKAENILLNKRNDAKISDLGIAKSQDFNATLTDHVAGSYCSMSPEQAMGEPLDFKSDLFSLGILAYQLLCGAHPFGDTSNKLQVMQRIISHPPIPPQKHNPSLPVEICNLLGQLLSKNPENRPDNTGWVAAEFERLSLISIDECWDGDETQALTSNNVLADLHHKNRKLQNTGEHPTFDTRFTNTYLAQPKLSSKALSIVRSNWGIILSAVFTILILVSFVLWSTRPLPPKYVAVIPPKLISKDTPLDQQRLIKAAIFDAIQQSVIASPHLYLIPEDEIDNNQNLDSIFKATASNLIITSDINCHQQACNLVITQLSKSPQDPHLRVVNRETLDILADNYLQMGSTIRAYLARIFLNSASQVNKSLNALAYQKLLSLQDKYQNHAERQILLSDLEHLDRNVKALPLAKTLFRKVAIDLYMEQQNSVYLDRAEKFLSQPRNEDETRDSLINLFYLQTAKGDITAAQNNLTEIERLGIDDALKYQLYAELALEKNDYTAATTFYKNALSLRPAASIYYHTAISSFYKGDSTQARSLLDKALQLSPKYYDALSLSGSIALYDGDIDSAESKLNSAYNIRPDDTYNLSNLGLTYMLSGRLPRALELFSKALTLAPDQLTFLLNKADALDLLGEKEQANLAYRQIIAAGQKADSTNAQDQLVEIAQAYAHIGDFSNAMAVLKQLETKNSQSMETYYAAALVHSLAGNNRAALFNIEGAIDKGMNKLWFNLPWFKSLCPLGETTKVSDPDIIRVCSKL